MAAAVIAPFVAGEVEQVIVSPRGSSRPGPSGWRSASSCRCPTRGPRKGRRDRPSGTAGAAPAPSDGAASSGATGRSATPSSSPTPPSCSRPWGPRAAETEIFGALLEAAASEVTARQRAMAAATDNAGDLITKYTRIMNRARQDSITTEIMEIVGGAEALRAGSDEDEGGIVDRGPRMSADSPHRVLTPPTAATDQPSRGSTPVTATAEQPPPPSTHASGRVVAIAGPVIDVEFPPHALPEINGAVEVDATVDGKTEVIVAEVAQQIGDGRVRCICLRPTDGLTRGAEVRNPGHGLRVPVGDAVLGHVFNVLGQPLDTDDDR